MPCPSITSVKLNVHIWKYQNEYQFWYAGFDVTRWQGKDQSVQTDILDNLERKDIAWTIQCEQPDIGDDYDDALWYDDVGELMASVWFNLSTCLFTGGGKEWGQRNLGLLEKISITSSYINVIILWSSSPLHYDQQCHNFLGKSSSLSLIYI